MKVLMLGWEFPPINTGGLGVASTFIAKFLAQNNQDIQIHFAIPTFIFNQLKEKHRPTDYQVVELKEAKNLTICTIKSTIHSPYVTAQQYQDLFSSISQKNGDLKQIYGENLFAEIQRFAQEVADFVKGKKYDIIHAHDWITFHAGVKAKELTKAKLITHIHATEIDRTGGHPDPEIFRLEREGLEAADHIISVSDYTKNILKNYYRIPGAKITAVHNGIDKINHHDQPVFSSKDKIVLFLGRLTLQKGPDYFLEIARKVVRKNPDIKFVYGGEGDMLPQIMSKIIKYNLQQNVFCAGFLGPKEKAIAFQRAAAYIMPSVSEPFGLSAIEAVNANVPTIICKQSGVSEIISNSFKSDFWDTDRMAEQVLALVKYPALSTTMIPAAKRELNRFTWHHQVNKIVQVYRSLV